MLDSLLESVDPSLNKVDTIQFGSWVIKLFIISEWPNNIPTIRQVHGSYIISADDISGNLQEADGIGIRLSHDKRSSNPLIKEVGIKTADCLPLVLMTETVALLLHTSRKTLIHGLLNQVTRWLDPAMIKHVYVGPHICPEHFTFEWVGPDLARFIELFPAAVDEYKGIYSLSLRDAVQEYFNTWRVREEIIEEDLRCTFEASELASYVRSLRSGEKLNSHLATVVAKN